jgi:hypothetical protein
MLRSLDWKKRKVVPCVWCMNIFCFHEWKHFEL